MQRQSASIRFFFWFARNYQYLLAGTFGSFAVITLAQSRDTNLPFIFYLIPLCLFGFVGGMAMIFLTANELSKKQESEASSQTTQESALERLDSERVRFRSVLTDQKANITEKTLSKVRRLYRANLTPAQS